MPSSLPINRRRLFITFVIEKLSFHDGRGREGWLSDIWKTFSLVLTIALYAHALQVLSSYPTIPGFGLCVYSSNTAARPYHARIEEGEK